MKKSKIVDKLKVIRGSKYRMRLLMALFAVAVLAIGFIDITVFRGLYSNIKEDSEKKTKEMLWNITESYENQIAQYQDQAMLLYSNLDVIAYLVSGGNEDSHINSIYKSMKAIAGNMTGISSVILFDKNDILASYDTRMVMTEAKEEIVEKIKTTTSDKEVFLIDTDVRNYSKKLVVFWSDREYLYGPSNYGVALVIQIDAIQEKVVPWKSNAESPIYIFHKDGELVVSQKNEYKEVMQNIFQKISKQEQNEGSLYEMIDGEKLIITYVRSENGRFITVRIQETPSSQSQVMRALRTILFSTILGMLIMAVIVWILSGWMYRPLGAIFRDIRDIAQIEDEQENEKDELLLAANALKDVNQNIDFLKNQIRNNAVIRFLRYGINGDEIDSNMFELGDSNPDAFCLMVLRYSLEDWTKNEILLSYLRKVTWHKETNEIRVHCYRVMRGEIVLLAYGETGGKELPNKKERAEKILSDLESLYDINGCIGIASCTSLSDLPKAYQTAEMLTVYHILSKKIKIIDESMLEQKVQGAIQEPERERILRFVKEEEEENILECLHSLLENLTSYHIREAQNYLQSLIAEVIRLSESICGEKNEQYETYLEDFLTNRIFISQVDFEEWLCQLFLQVRMQLKERRQLTTVKTMSNVVKFINENYSDCSLSVENVAERYGLSVSYFSKLFNNYTGKTFPDYMNQLRLQKAREMLLEDQQTSIQEIAKQVGFNSSSYFSAAFRKTYGVSPSQIRRLMTS